MATPPDDPKTPETVDFQAEERKVKEVWQRYIAHHWKRPVACPICGSTDWANGTPADLPLRYQAGKVLTVMPVRCKSCAYTIFFNLVSAGLYADGMVVDWQPPSEPEPPVDPSGETEPARDAGE